MKGAENMTNDGHHYPYGHYSLHYGENHVDESALIKHEVFQAAPRP
jgi:hypothetical protein